MLKKILLICMISLLAFGDAGIVLPPGWVQPEGYTRTFSMSARVVGSDGNTFVETAGSTLAAFGADGTCRGLATGEATANGTFIYSYSISSNLAIENGITLKILDAQAGEVYDVKETFVFLADNVIGSATNPYILHAKVAAEQMLTFSPGWNWVGFTFLPESRKVGDVLGKTGFTANDVIQTNGGSTRFMGTGWLPNSFTVEYGKLYQVYAANPVTVTISGDASSERSLPLISGWNWIANPTTTAVTPSQLTHSGGWTASDRIQSTSGTVIYTGSKWIPADGITLEPGKGCQIYTANEGTLTFPKVDEENALYAVVDLSGGPDAASYPMRYTNTSPNLDDDTCRTTELWLRRIPKGTFIMGSPEGEVGRWYEKQHQVTLTQDFYIGVFECTQKQWELVMGGDNPAIYEGDCRPVARVSYNMIRGSSETAGAGWPTYGHAVDASSFMGKLQTKTGLTFDLPTEAQWEYACRAGTTTALNSGKNLTSTDQDVNMDEVGRYYFNQSDGKGGYSQHTKVGSYLPNAWGLYDMHGNVEEWCLDWYLYGSYGTEALVDPQGPDTGSYRVVRGGYWSDYAQNCRSAHRYHTSHGSDGNGFRVLCLPLGR